MSTSRRPLRLRTALAAAAVTALTVVGTPTTTPPAEAAPADGPTCLGRAATIVGTNRDDTLTGTRGDDVILARIGDDVVDGRGGDDRICGGGGDDVLRGTGGDDQVDGGYGADLLEGGAGDDRLIGAEDLVGVFYRGDTLDGGVGDDRMLGDRTTDPVGDARFYGEDTVTYAEARSGVRADLSDAAGTEGAVVRSGDDRDRVVTTGAVVGSSFDDRLTTSAPGEYVDLAGGPGDDVLAGVVVDGGLGDDVITAGEEERFGGGSGTGGPGADEITVIGPDGAFSAGPGDDVVTTTGAGTVVGDGPGDDTVTFGATGGILAGPGTDVVVGSPGDDFLGVAAGDTVSGGGGDDGFKLRDGTLPTSLDGGAGRDAIKAGELARGRDQGSVPVVVDLAAGRMTFDGGSTSLAGLEIYNGPRSQRSTVTGSDGPETVRTGCLVDTITTGGGADRVFPYRGDDQVDTGEGDDLVSEEDFRCRRGLVGDDDELVAGPGTDTVDVEQTRTSASGEGPSVVDLAAGTADVSGSDTLAGFENIIGSDVTDVLRGDAGPNVISSQRGRDRLFGRGGDDRLVADYPRYYPVTADGGAGVDACRARVEVSCETDLDAG